MKIKNYKSKLKVILLLIALILLFIHHCKNLVLPYSPGFFPRSDLSQIYSDFQDSQEQNREGDSSDHSIVAEAEAYYQNMRYSRIIGTLHQYSDHEFTVSFDECKPDQETEMLNVIKDYGVFIYDHTTGIVPNLKNFDFIACQYKKNDFVSRDLSVVYEAGDREFALGYIQAEYVSVTGKVRSELRPLDGGPIVLKTRDGGYFLKEFCVFWAYDSGDNRTRDEIQYQIKSGDEELCKINIP